MDKLIRILAGLAIVQLVFVVFTNMGGHSLAGQAPNQPLLSFDKEQVDTLIIQGGKKAKVTLNKKEGKWQTEEGFPANQEKVESLIGKMHEMKHGLPVASSDAAIKRFKVANDQYERYITLQKGDQKLAALYMGTGAGVRQTHVRNDKDVAVYTGSMGIYDAPDTLENWQDKTILQFNKEEISRIKLEDKVFQRIENKDKQSKTMQWQSADLPKGKRLNQKAINDGLSSLANLMFNKVLGKESKSEYGTDKPVLKLHLMLKKGGREYLLGQLKDKDDYVLKVSDRPEYFQLDSHVAKSIVDSSKRWLTDKAKEGSKATEDDKSDLQPIMDNPPDNSGAK
jgi:hypothetical protein